MKFYLYLFITVTFFALSATQQQLIEERAEDQEWLKTSLEASKRTANTQLLEKHKAYNSRMRFAIKSSDVLAMCGMHCMAGWLIEKSLVDDGFLPLAMAAVGAGFLLGLGAAPLYFYARAYASSTRDVHNWHCTLPQEILDLADDDQPSIVVHRQGFRELVQLAYENEEKYKRSWQFLANKYFKQKVRNPLLPYYIGVYKESKHECKKKYITYRARLMFFLSKNKIPADLLRENIMKAYFTDLESLPGIKYVFVDSRRNKISVYNKACFKKYYLPEIEYFVKSKDQLDNVHQQTMPAFDEIKLVNSDCNSILVSKKTLASLLPYLPLVKFANILDTGINSNKIGVLLFQDKFCHGSFSASDSCVLYDYPYNSLFGSLFHKKDRSSDYYLVDYERRRLGLA
ncbi:MAG: hypothetical protein WC707_05300 [Candidatus Babeliaceae bacterium]|jgi:hypothetical protein